jgi:hypothetical protein
VQHPKRPLMVHALLEAYNLVGAAVGGADISL